MLTFEQIVAQIELLSNDIFGLAVISFSNEWEPERKRREIVNKNIKFKPKRTKALKAFARTGLANNARRRWWFVLSGGLDLYSKVGDIYSDAIKSAAKVEMTNNWKFGLTYEITDYLPPKISEILPNFLHTLWYYNRAIEFSPLIPVLSAMMLMFMEPKLAYISMQSLINISRENQFFLLVNKSQLCAQINALEKLIYSRVNHVALHAKKLGIDIAELALSLFPSFFIPFMAILPSLTFFDSFLSEGRKVLFRFTLQILIEEETNLLSTTSQKTFASVLFIALEKLNTPDRMQTFLKNAFKIKMKRKNHICKVEKASNQENCSHFSNQIPEITNMLLSKKVRRHSSCQFDIHLDIHSDNNIDNYLDHNMDSHLVMNDDDLNEGHHFPVSMEALHSNRMRLLSSKMAKDVLQNVDGGNLLRESTLLSMRNEMSSVFSHYSADLAYKMSEDGVSLTTIFQKCSILCQYILIIKTTEKIVGAFLSDPIKPTNHGRYHGTGMTFVFDVTNSNFYKLRPPGNNLFLSISNDSIMVGGPNPAMIISQDCKFLVSMECETFGSPKLTKNVEGDEILEIEIYRFVSPYHFSHKWQQSYDNQLTGI